MLFPIGPYHPALIEPISLRLALRGETVVGVETHTGYLHRGIEQLATERPLTETLNIVERISGTSGHSHRLALCLALESLADVTPTPRAQSLRMIFAEVERVLARLWLLMQVGRASEFGTLFTTAVEARELLFEACVQAAGTRLFWGVAVPGGAVNSEDPAAFSEAITAVSTRLAGLEPLLAVNGQFYRRSSGAGTIYAETAQDLQLTGLLLRATGITEDVRVDSPYEGYADFESIMTASEAVPQNLKGDVYSRVRLAVADIRTSFAIITTLLDELPDGQERATFADMVPVGTTTTAVEGPHGRELNTLTVGTASQGTISTTTSGWLQSFHLETSSARNVGIIPIILQKHRLSDVPLTLASLDIAIADVDL